jgi:acetate kinase
MKNAFRPATAFYGSVALPFVIPKRSRGICSSADLSWKCFSTGKTPCLSVLDGKNPSHTEPISAKDYGEAATSIFRWLEKEKHIRLEDIRCVGVRVVHGGRSFTGATRVTAEVEREYAHLSGSRPCIAKALSNSSNPSAAG